MGRSAGKPRVLVVEDEPNIRNLLELVLAIDWEVILVDSGLKAVEACSRSDFDLVIMDLQLPVMGGLEAAAKIRKMERERGKNQVPIVAVTARVSSEERQRVMEAGMDDFIPKPFKTLELMEVLKKFIRVQD